jgi:perosamine synthetase
VEGMFPVTEKISSQVLTLPMYPGLTREDMDYMIDAMYGFFEINKD